MPRKPWRRDRIVTQVRQWLTDERNRSFAFEEPRRKIAAFLEGVPVGPHVITQRLRNLARWYAAVALTEAETGHERECARQMYDAHLCDLIGMAMLAHRSDGYGERERRVISANDAAFAIARAVAIGASADARRMHALVGSRISTSVHGLEDSRIVPLILEVCGKAFQQPVDLAGFAVEREPAYERVTTLWDSVKLDELAGCLEAACTVHVERSGDHTDSETYEFWEQVSQVYAAEIVMVFGLRQEKGLPIPAVEHPLLTGSLARVLRTSPGDADDLLARLYDYASRDVPELERR